MASAQDEDPLKNLFDGRFIVLPNVLCTMQHVKSSRKSTHPRRHGADPSQDSSDSDAEDERRASDAGAVDEHLAVRAVLGPLRAHLRTELISEALGFVAKLEDQIHSVTQSWVEAEESRKDGPSPSIEENLNRAASRVRMWYQLSVVFTGVRVRVEVYL